MMIMCANAIAFMFFLQRELACIYSQTAFSELPSGH